MAKYGFSCAWSHPQGLLEGELLQDWHKNVSDLPVSIANVNANWFGRKNKNHKGVSSTVMVFVATFISINL